MTPEYIEQLAERADPGQLWRLPALEQLDLPMAKRHQLDSGVALRRHAEHLRRLEQLRHRGLSLLITPLSPSATATRGVSTPLDHQQLRRTGNTTQCEVCGAGSGQHYGNCKYAIRGVNMIIGPGE